MRNAYEMLIGRSEKRPGPFGILGSGGGANNITMNLRETVHELVNCIHLAHDGVQQCGV
jgi:hypothetical protein